MTTYRAPQRDMRFVLHELLEVERLAALPGYADATPDVIDAVIEEGAKFCENVLFPINRTSDEQGCVYENGVVRTPGGFKEAYDRFVEGGWTGLAADPHRVVDRVGAVGGGGRGARGVRGVERSVRSRSDLRAARTVDHRCPRRPGPRARCAGLGDPGRSRRRRPAPLSYGPPIGTSARHVPPSHTAMAPAGYTGSHSAQSARGSQTSIR